ncbi:MAG: DUF4185 domain-containing protein [Anaerolineae bacterium]
MRRRAILSLSVFFPLAGLVALAKPNTQYPISDAPTPSVQADTGAAYLPLVANGWRRPPPHLTPTASATSSPSPTTTATSTPTLTPTPAAATVRYVSGSSQKVCQLTGEFDRERQQTTLNRTESRFGVIGTDLGASFEHAGRLYFLFGDTVGVERRGGDSIAYSEDTDPDDCVTMSFVIARDGLYLPPHVPGVSLGAFEVPSGGFSAGEKMYVFFTTDHSEQTMMGRSVLALSTDGAQSYEYLYDVSRDKFINIAPAIVDNADVPGLPEGNGQGLLLWGSGPYRHSDPYLAFMPLSGVEDHSSLRYFTGLDSGSGSPLWSTAEAEAATLFSQPCIGELSVAWNPFLRRWLMLYNCADPRGINFRVADQPWGPWSEAQVLFHPWEDGGYCHFMHVSWESQNCDSVHDPGRQNVWGGEYGPYLIPRYAVGDDSRTTIYYVMSTWNPYNVVLMKSTLHFSSELLSSLSRGELSSSGLAKVIQLSRILADERQVEIGLRRGRE